MAGSVLFGVLFVVVLLLILVGIASPLWLLPIAVIGLPLLLLPPPLPELRGPPRPPAAHAGAREASRPRDRAAGQRSAGRSDDERPLVRAGPGPRRAPALTP